MTIDTTNQLEHIDKESIFLDNQGSNNMNQREA